MEPLAPPGKYSYFNIHGRKKNGLDKRTAYDRLHDKSSYDFTKPRCDRRKQSTIWMGIHEENKNQKVGKTTSLWYGRPNRIQIDIPESKFHRANIISEWFFNKNNINLAPDLNRDLLPE